MLSGLYASEIQGGTACPCVHLGTSQYLASSLVLLVARNSVLSIGPSNEKIVYDGFHYIDQCTAGIRSEGEYLLVVLERICRCSSGRMERMYYNLPFLEFKSKNPSTYISWLEKEIFLEWDFC